MPVRAPADKRFKRARVQPPRKKRSWRAWGVTAGKGALFVIVLAYATGRGVQLLTSAPSLRITQVKVQGNRQLATRTVHRLLGGATTTGAATNSRAADNARAADARSGPAARAGSSASRSNGRGANERDATERGANERGASAARASGGLMGSNIMLADLDGWRGRLLRSPWIKEAALRRVLPSTIEVAIVEREPLGIGRLRDRLYLVAADGMILDEYGARYAGYDLPIIDGLHVPENANGLLVDEARSAFAADVLRDLRRSTDLAARVSQVDVSNADDAVVLLADDTARVHLGREAYADRLRSYLNLAPTLRARVSGIDYVDLRFDPRIFVRPIGGKKTMLTTADAAPPR